MERAKRVKQKDVLVYQRRRFNSQGEKRKKLVQDHVEELPHPECPVPESSQSLSPPATLAPLETIGNISPTLEQIVPIPKDWKCAKQDPRWKDAMKEKFNALVKNKTWELVRLPPEKKAVRLITGDDVQEIRCLKERSGKTFELKDLGLLRYFLGIEIARSSKGIVLSQWKYVLDLLTDTEMLGCRPSTSPIDRNHQLCSQSGDPVDKEAYQRLVRRLIYLCHIRHDISYAVSVVSRYMHDPRTGHLDVVHRILRYLKGTPGKGLWFRKNGHLNMEGYCDADWASSMDDRRSTSSKKQAVVAQSTAEVEYRVMALGLSEMLWMRSLLFELRVLRSDTMMLHCDNKSAINIANNPVQHDRTKHVEIDRFFIKENIDSGVLRLEYIKSCEQLADYLTKGLLDTYHYLTPVVSLVTAVIGGKETLLMTNNHGLSVLERIFSSFCVENGQIRYHMYLHQEPSR
uniref:Uncharacterized protein OSJNBb0111K12.14 n=1 Tax=Oryza sativa subsp. japonica TaxID=39947 RepID=Q75IS7_ORYSJ|nr:hypothetical protein [Oryza sativa Japonica Group]